MHHGLTAVDAMSVGMFVQTLMLALTEQGLGTCLQVSVTGYSEVLRMEFGIGVDRRILCGIAVGYPAPHNKVSGMLGDFIQRHSNALLILCDAKVNVITV